jgi:hypothetical protein
MAGISTIWKYSLFVTDEQIIRVPEGAEPLAVMMQFGVGNVGALSLWVLVPDTSAPKYAQFIHVYGTGNPIPAGQDEVYIGSVMDREFVWHCYWVVAE